MGSSWAKGAGEASACERRSNEGSNLKYIAQLSDDFPIPGGQLECAKTVVARAAE